MHFQIIIGLKSQILMFQCRNFSTFCNKADVLSDRPTTLNQTSDMGKKGTFPCRNTAMKGFFRVIFFFKLQLGDLRLKCRDFPMIFIRFARLQNL